MGPYSKLIQDRMDTHTPLYLTELPKATTFGVDMNSKPANEMLCSWDLWLRHAKNEKFVWIFTS